MSLPAAQPGLLLTLIPLLPLAGALTLWCGAWSGLRAPGRSIALLAAGLSLLAIVAALLVLGVTGAQQTFTGGRWLTVRGGAGGTISLSLRWDGLAAVWLLVQTAAALLVLSGTREREHTAANARSMVAWSLALLGLVDLLALAGNYWQLFVCWELSLIAAWRLLANAAENELDARSADRMLWTGLIGDLPLLVGLLAIWQAFGTLDYRAVLQNGLADGSAPDSSSEALRGFASFCLVIAALCRCAQFPVCNWLPPVAGTRSVTALWGTLIGVVPAGALLLLRSAPLLEMNPAALSLLVNWGCLSAAVWGCLALTQPDSQRALASFVAGTLGLVCAGIGAAGASGLQSATFLTCNLAVISAALLWLLPPTENEVGSDVRGGGRRAAVCLAVMIGSGIWGQEAVLRDLWKGGYPPIASQQLETGTDENDTAPVSQGPSAVAPLVAIVGHLLLCVSLFCALLRSKTEPIRGRIGVVAVTVIAAGLLVPLLFAWRPGLSDWAADNSAGRTELLLRLCTPGMTGLLMLLGLLLAWLAAVKFPHAGTRFEQTFGSLARLSRRGFYVDEACWICCGLPLSICANVCRFLEQHVWERDLFSGDDGLLLTSDAAGADRVDDRSLMPVLVLFVAAGAVLVILLLEG